jgi:hypothetical protein
MNCEDGDHQGHNAEEREDGGPDEQVWQIAVGGRGRGRPAIRAGRHRWYAEGLEAADPAVGVALEHLYGKATRRRAWMGSEDRNHLFQ